MQSMLRLTLISLLLAPAVAPAQIYKQILPDGSVVYSDQAPPDGAQAIELPPLQTYSPPPLPEPAPARAEVVPKLPEPAADMGYVVLEVIAPGPDATIRSNGGTIDVQLAIEPALREGHVVEILVDGKATRIGSASSASVSDLGRGSHMISAQVKDRAGNILAKSSDVTFHLLRISKLPPARIPKTPVTR